MILLQYRGRGFWRGGDTRLAYKDTTPDVNEAVRFERRIDAQRVMEHFPVYIDWQVVEL